MPYLRGEDINIGFGFENPDNRGEYVEPQIWVPGRSPAGIIIEPEFVEIKETKGSGIDAQDSEMFRRKAIGDFEFNVRVESIGFFLKSWLGKVTSSGIESGVYQHDFEVLEGNPEHPSLSASLSLPGHNDYKYPLTLVKTFNLKTPIEDVVNATVGFIAKDENQGSVGEFTPTWEDNDYRFRHQDITIKLADDEAGLDSAEAIYLNNFEMSADNSARLSQSIGSLTARNVIALLQAINIDFTSDYLDETYRELLMDSEMKAIRLEMKREDIDYAGGNNPMIRFDFPQVKLSTRTQDRPMEDVAIDSCTARVFSSPKIKVVNERENYNHA